jgi:predicted nicotinamide N-methyase
LTALICAALYTTAKKVFITDIHDPTLQNAAFNMKLNATQTHETDVDNYDMSINVSCLEDNETTKEASFVEEEQSESEINVSADTASNFIAQSNVTKKILTNSKEKNTQSDANTVTSSCDVTLLKLNWDDPKTFPSEKIRIIIGSDLVYDESILAMLVKALDLLLDNGNDNKSTLY